MINWGKGRSLNQCDTTPYVISKVLEKWAYELVDYDEIPFAEPHNEICLKVTIPRTYCIKTLYICVYLTFSVV